MLSRRDLTRYILHVVCFLLSDSAELATGNIMKLNESNFEQTVFRSDKNGMVKFYQSWCGHSIKMKPTWEDLAKISDPSVFIASIECGENKDLCLDYQIKTYPTFRYYRDGVEHDYNDALSLEALREFVETTLAPQCNPIALKGACSEKALKYADKWIKKSSGSGDIAILKSELERLNKILLNSESVTPDQKRWIQERRNILQIIQTNAHVKGSEEL